MTRLAPRRQFEKSQGCHVGKPWLGDFGLDGTGQRVALRAFEPPRNYVRLRRPSWPKRTEKSADRSISTRGRVEEDEPLWRGHTEPRRADPRLVIAGMVAAWLVRDNVHHDWPFIDDPRGLTVSTRTPPAPATRTSEVKPMNRPCSTKPTT